MNNWYGNLLEDATVEMTFNTFDADGESVTVTDFASTDVHVHKDGGLTQTNAGVTIDIDFDGITGNHMIYIDTIADAFYATGSNYEVRVEGITVATKTINAFVGSFSIENRFMRGTDIGSLNNVAATDIVSAGAITTFTGSVVNVDNVLGNVQGNVQGNVTGSVSSVIADVSLGTDAVDANVLAADAVAEIQSGLALDSTVAKETTLDSVETKVDTIAVDVAGLDGDAMRGTDSAATETKQDASDVVLNRVSAIQEADKVFVPASGTLTYNTKGTSTGLLKKNLKDPAGAAVDSTEDIIASEVDTTP